MRAREMLGKWCSIPTLLFVFLCVSVSALSESITFKHVYTVEPDVGGCLKIFGGDSREKFYVVNNCSSDFSLVSFVEGEDILIKRGGSGGYYGIKELDARPCILDKCLRLSETSGELYSACVNDCESEKVNYTLYGRLGGEGIFIRGYVVEQRIYGKSSLNHFMRVLKRLVLPLLLVLFLGLQFYAYNTNRGLFFRHAFKNFVFLMLAVVFLYLSYS